MKAIAELQRFREREPLVQALLAEVGTRFGEINSLHLKALSAWHSVDAAAIALRRECVRYAAETTGPAANAAADSLEERDHNSEST